MIAGIEFPKTLVFSPDGRRRPSIAVGRDPVRTHMSEFHDAASSSGKSPIIEMSCLPAQIEFCDVEGVY